jgi:hypothetical protein
VSGEIEAEEEEDLGSDLKRVFFHLICRSFSEASTMCGWMTLPPQPSSAEWQRLKAQGASERQGIVQYFRILLSVYLFLLSL